MYGGLPEGSQGPDVFISYSSKDEIAARAVAKALRGVGVSCWFAADSMRWGSWPGQIVNRIRSCRVVVLLLSPNANRSVHVRREVYLATDFEKTVVPIELSPGELHDDLRYLLGSLEIIKAFDVGRLITEVTGGRAPGQLQTARPVSRFVKVCAALSGLVAVPLLVWAYLFTEAGWPIFLVVVAPLLIYRVLPDSWRRWTTATLRAAWTTPSLSHRLVWGTVSLVFVSLLGWTFTVGTVAVSSDETIERKVQLLNVKERPKRVSLGHNRTFQVPAGYEVVARVDRLPDRTRRPRRWATAWMHVPVDFIDLPTVLIVQDDYLKAMANRKYSVHIKVLRAGQVYEQRLELTSGDQRKAISPFWLGCSGSQEVRAPQVQELVRHDPPIEGAYPCRFDVRLAPDDALCVTVEDGENGFRLVRAFDRKLDGGTTDNQYAVRISDRGGSTQPCK
jgi:hypothetical protein